MAVLFATLLLGTANESLSQAVNLSATVGGTVVLPCSTTMDSPVDWLYQASPTSMEILICIGGNVVYAYTTRFSTNSTQGGAYDLHIHDVRPSDAGVYTCVEESGFGERHSVQLIVNQEEGEDGHSAGSIIVAVAVSSLVMIVITIIISVVIAALSTTTSCNMSVSVGESVSFSCSSNGSVIRWTSDDKQTRHPTVLYTGLAPNPNLNITERYSVSVDNQTGLSELTIKRAAVGDEGIYVCTELTPEAPTLQFQLVVRSTRSDATGTSDNHVFSDTTSTAQDSKATSSLGVFLVVQCCIVAVVLMVIAGICYKRKGYRVPKCMKKVHCCAEEGNATVEAADADINDGQAIQCAYAEVRKPAKSPVVVQQHGQRITLYDRLSSFDNDEYDYAGFRSASPDVVQACVVEGDDCQQYADIRLNSSN